MRIWMAVYVQKGYALRCEAFKTRKEAWNAVKAWKQTEGFNEQEDDAGVFFNEVKGVEQA